MINSIIDAVDVLDNAVSDITGASDALCFWATIEDVNLAAMLSRVLDEDAKALREAARWLEAHESELRVDGQDEEAEQQPV